MLIGKHAYRKRNIRHVRYWSKAIASNFSCFLTSKIAKIAKDKCSHCAMALDYYFRCLSTAPSNRIIALRAHSFSVFPKINVGYGDLQCRTPGIVSNCLSPSGPRGNSSHLPWCLHQVASDWSSHPLGPML